jgi:hypothetical protein
LKNGEFDTSMLLNDYYYFKPIEEPEEIDIQAIKEKNISYVVCSRDLETGDLTGILNEFFRENQEYIDSVLQAIKQLDNKLNNR